ncbi:MAG: hypothetical protein J0L60_13235 [Ignavibacteria bacterium]|nr:hypothetical protein [Ignavibacteria bacterium]
MKIKLTLLTMSAILMVLVAPGCKDNSTGTAPGDNVTVSMAKENSISKIPAEVLVLDTVKILLRDIKFSKPTGDSSNVKIGPMVIKLNLNGTPTEFAAGRIDATDYGKIKFRIHKLEDTELVPDPEFIDGFSPALRYSVIVKGRLNGIPFIYKSSKSAKQEVDFKKVLRFANDQRTNVTLFVDVNTWFLKGTAFLDPTNAANFNDIDNNIKDSFKKAYRDNDKNGIED